MSEIPERIEREMYEIRNRMSPDVRDLKKHTEPKVLGKQAGDKAKERLRDAASRFGRSLRDSAKRQLDLVKDVGRSKDPSALKNAVKSDPRPMVLLVVVLAFTLMTLRKISS
ncbi:DUF3618 domain-containing protein [Rubrobacter indicoceani]|uniref:DUF3618 domain-containing protein n=1 Tax=Rubrobacter indicoceani TaxID=2051957 RepID=UPI000E5BE641|nr:DUF3618 domain-containing protein [Rubrobacter indicoceani]